MHELETLLEMALLENNSSFANALIEKGVNLDNFLTYERLKRLYNSRKGSKVLHENNFVILINKIYNLFSFLNKRTLNRSVNI